MITIPITQPLATDVITTGNHNRPPSTTNGTSPTTTQVTHNITDDECTTPNHTLHLWQPHTFDDCTPPTTAYLWQALSSPLNLKHTTHFLSPLIFITPSHIYYSINSSPTTVQHALVKVGISYKSLLGKTLRNLVRIFVVVAWCCARNLHCYGTWVMIDDKGVT